MNRAERRRQERDARKKPPPRDDLASPARVDIAAIKRRLQQQTTPEQVQRLIGTLVAQGLPREAGEELSVYAAEFHDAAAILKVRETTVEQVPTLVNNAHSWADTMISQSPEQERRACKAGCAFCCYVPTVLVTAAEAVYLADWLRINCSTEELATVKQRLSQRQQQTKARSSSVPTKPFPCALLQDNQCMAYAARPLKCRGWNSLRRDVCERAYGHSQSQVQIPADAYAFVMGNAVLSGLSDSATSAGLDGATYDLTSALLRALETPNATDRWRKGERLFSKSQRQR